MKIRLLLLSVLAAALVAPVAPVPLAWAGDAKKQQKEEKPEVDTYQLLNLLGDVFERVRADYVEQPSDEQLIEAAITGMLAALDPHSSYLNKKSFQEMKVQTRGEFGGLGIEVTMENGLVKVVSPIDDTPAFRAGLEPGDIITHLDTEPVLGLTLAEAVDKMRGKVGTDIKLTIRRAGREPFDVNLTRAVIKIRSVRSHLEGKIGYVRITSFNEQAEDGLKKAMKKFNDELGHDLQGLVLDLRNNPGGLLDQAIKVSDAFLEQGEVVSTRSRQPEDTQRFNATPGDLAKGLPVVVLINGGSASASEIVAGALQDHRRAVILGTKSFGKGSVQTIIPLAGHGAMRLTTSRYFTPSGRSIQKVGIEPDIAVEQARIEQISATKSRHEADLRGALENPKAPKAGEPAEKAPEKPQSKEEDPDEPLPDEEADKDGAAKNGKDYQLARALDLLRGIALYSKKAGN